MIQPRLLFPLTMFVLAGLSFAYGTWQWFSARAVQASADARIAYTLQAVQNTTTWSSAQKQAFYSALFEDYPPGPKVFGIDFSGIFAAEQSDDQCRNDGQRAVCRALVADAADAATITAVCGACNPTP